MKKQKGKTTPNHKKNDASVPANIFPLSYQLMGIVLCFVLVLFVYFVFIPQMSLLNAIQENTCHYIDHSIGVTDPEHCHPELKEQCYRYTVHVSYEHEHNSHGDNHRSHGDNSSTKHEHRGIIQDQETSRENIESLVGDLKKKKQFPCFVNILYPDHHVYLEKPSAWYLWCSTLFLFGLGSIATWLLKCYVDWSESYKLSSKMQKGQVLSSRKQALKSD